MNPELNDSSVEFERVCEAAIASGGGVNIVRRCHKDAARRLDVESLLAPLGVWDLVPRADEDQLQAAAVACRAAGRFALPYPVAERLAVDRSGPFGALAVMGRGMHPRVHMADIGLKWAVCNCEGLIAPIVHVGQRLGTELGAFVSDVQVGDLVEGSGADYVLLLQAWTLLGMVEAAAEQTYTYVQQRQQFGKPLSSSQVVQFRLADVEVALKCFFEMAKYALWSVATRRPSALVDVLALRCVALESADSTFRAAHQLHGAIGFCDETDLSWLSRMSQPLRRLPWGHSQTEERLLELMQTQPFDSLFSIDRLDGEHACGSPS